MSPVSYGEPARGEDVERRDVVEDEEEVAGEEDEVVQEVDREVSHAEVEDGGLRGGVGRSEEGAWGC